MAQNGGLDRTELISAVCTRWVDGYKNREILADMAEKYPKNPLKRREPSSLVREAARKGWFRFQPPQEWKLARDLKRDYPRLNHVEVLHTTEVEPVARLAAEALLRLARNLRIRHGKREVHIGFSGGQTTCDVARAFADVLSDATDDLPDTIVIHALAPSFDLTNPGADPNTFFHYFQENLPIDTEMGFVGFAAPPIVTSADIPTLLGYEDIKFAHESAKKDIDIIVASGSLWGDCHSALRNCMLRSPEAMRILKLEGCVADIMWRPVSDRGPIEAETDIRAMTLVELGDLPGWIEQGKHVLFVLAPCGKCGGPKGRLLWSLLKQRPLLMTDLVVDSRTAKQMMNLKSRSLDH